MEFEWSEAKRLAVLRARGLDFIDGQELFNGLPLYTVSSPRSTESRWVSAGELNGRLIAIVWTLRDGTTGSLQCGGREVRRKGDIVRYTAEELDEMRRRGKGQTDWAKVDAMTEEELAASIAADPDDVHEEPDWSKAIKGLPPMKQHINIRIDGDVLYWFKATGRGYQTRINNVLRAYVESRKRA